MEATGLKSQVDAAYIISIPGILKLIEIIFGVIASLCLSGPAISLAARGFFLFCTLSTLICTAVLLLCFFFRIPGRFAKPPWGLIEFIYTIVATVLYLISSCIVAGYSGVYGPWIAGAVFGFLNMVVYLLGLFLSFRLWRAEHEMAQDVVT